MSTSTGGPTGPADGPLLRRASDIVQVVYPLLAGEAHVVQFAGGENSIVFTDGGPLVWTVLALCDGTRTIEELTAELRARFKGPESLWAEEVPKLLDDLWALRVVEDVRRDQPDPVDVPG